MAQFVLPRMAEARSLRARAASLDAAWQQAATTLTTVPANEADAGSLPHQAWTALSAAARDSSAAYQLLLDRAAAAGIEVETVNPQPPADRGHGCEARGYIVHGHGSIEAAHRFLEALGDLRAFTRLEGMDLTPGSDDVHPGGLRLQFHVEFLAFSVVTASDVAGADSGGQP